MTIATTSVKHTRQNVLALAERSFQSILLLAG